jgi:hypothetical protein
VGGLPVGDRATVGDRLAACGADLLDYILAWPLTVGRSVEGGAEVVDHYAGASCRHGQADAPANTPPTPGDQSHFAFQQSAHVALLIACEPFSSV